MQMKKQKMTAYQNQNGVDFVEVLPYEILTDLVSMYICTMHPNYRLLLSECKKTDEGQICVFVKKNALPIKCVVSRQGDKQDFVADKNFQKIYHFCGEWVEVYNNHKDAWVDLRKVVYNTDFSWEKSAKEYWKMYETLI